jgi:hypothetical protein
MPIAVPSDRCRIASTVVASSSATGSREGLHRRQGKGVEKVTVIWDDSTKDLSYGGVHSDQGIAEALLAALATRYAPASFAEVLDAFRGTKPKTIRSASFGLRYTYRRGPAIDERLLTITQK